MAEPRPLGFRELLKGINSVPVNGEVIPNPSPSSIPEARAYIGRGVALFVRPKPGEASPDVTKHFLGRTAFSFGEDSGQITVHDAPDARRKFFRRRVVASGAAEDVLVTGKNTLIVNEVTGSTRAEHNGHVQVDNDTQELDVHDGASADIGNDVRGNARVVNARQVRVGNRFRKLLSISGGEVFGKSAHMVKVRKGSATFSDDVGIGTVTNSDAHLQAHGVMVKEGAHARNIVETSLGSK